MFFICGDLGLALLQLLTHGVCKCYLFMSVGDLMSAGGRSQRSVGVYSLRYLGVLGSCIQTLLIVSLSGLPFLGVFFRKHCLFSGVIYSYGLGFLLLLLACFLLTYIYSIRLILMLLKNTNSLRGGYSSRFLLIVVVCLLGTFINYFGRYNMVNEVFLGDFIRSLALLGVQLSGCILGCLIYLFNGFSLSHVWASVLWGRDCLVASVYSIYLIVSE